MAEKYYKEKLLREEEERRRRVKSVNKNNRFETPYERMMREQQRFRYPPGGFERMKQRGARKLNIFNIADAMNAANNNGKRGDSEANMRMFITKLNDKLGFKDHERIKSAKYMQGVINAGRVDFTDVLDVAIENSKNKEIFYRVYTISSMKTGGYLSKKSTEELNNPSRDKESRINSKKHEMAMFFSKLSKKQAIILNAFIANIYSYKRLGEALSNFKEKFKKQNNHLLASTVVALPAAEGVGAAGLSLYGMAAAAVGTGMYLTKESKETFEALMEYHRQAVIYGRSYEAAMASPESAKDRIFIHPESPFPLDEIFDTPYPEKIDSKNPGYQGDEDGINDYEKGSPIDSDLGLADGVFVGPEVDESEIGENIYISDSKRKYVPNSKHDKAVGKISPNPFGKNHALGQKVLDSAYESPLTKQLYNIYNGKIVKFQPDNSGGYHPYSVINTATEVPIDIYRQMLNDGKIDSTKYRKLIKNK